MVTMFAYQGREESSSRHSFTDPSLTLLLFVERRQLYAAKLLAAAEDELCFREKLSWKIIGLGVSGRLLPSWFVTLGKSFHLSVSLFLSPIK